MSEEKRSVPLVEIDREQCKGCELCIGSCPKNVLKMSTEMNHLGYCFSTYTGQGCIGCGFCYYSCPEPGAITVYKKGKEA